MTNFHRFGAEIMLENLLNKDWRALFSIMWSRASIPSNLMTGFRATYTFASNIIPEEAFFTCSKTNNITVKMKFVINI
jgi:hypothetical protein